MRNIDEYRTTLNRSVYNKCRKEYLYQHQNLNCTRCQYHRNDNYTGNSYGSYNGGRIKYPSWKLVSKNKSQWQDNNLKIKTSGRYIIVEF